MAPWSRLRRRLEEISSQAPSPPPGGRRAAALALLSEGPGEDLEILLTRRRDDLRTHPGQISFPGGRVDPGETVVDAAIREASEECGLDPGSITVVGSLPIFYIPPSRFWLQVVVARWDTPHPLVPEEAEVAEILRVSTDQLRDESRWRVVKLSSRGDSWAWQLDGGHVLWGATGVVTAVLLGLLDPTWCDGADPSRFPPEREVRPWEGLTARRLGSGPAQLAGVPEQPVTLSAAGARSRPQHPSDVPRAGAVVADAVETLLPDGRGTRVCVLAGSGNTGAVGVEAGARLAERGVAVDVVEAASLGDDGLPAAGLVLDALVGRGLDGPLRSPALDAVLALRTLTAPVVSVDLPTGIHPDDGIVGEAVSADVTVALGSPAPGLFGPGIAPFVGDLYLVGLDAGSADPVDSLVRLVDVEPAQGWRE